MNLWVPKMRGISWLAAEPVSFSRRILLHGVSKSVSKCEWPCVVQHFIMSAVTVVLLMTLGISCSTCVSQIALVVLEHSSGWCHLTCRIMPNSTSSPSCHLQFQLLKDGWRNSSHISPSHNCYFVQSAATLVLNGYRVSLAVLNLPKPEADHSPPSSAEDKNVWSRISTPPLHDVMASTRTIYLVFVTLRLRINFRKDGSSVY